MNPKFKVGDQVTAKSKYNGIIARATVENVTRTFSACDANGQFERGGLVTVESDIKSICLPYRFDGETLEVDHPETKFATFTMHAHTHRSRFSGYSYTIRDNATGQRYGMPERKMRGV